MIIGDSPRRNSAVDVLEVCEDPVVLLTADRVLLVAVKRQKVHGAVVPRVPATRQGHSAKGGFVRRACCGPHALQGVTLGAYALAAPDEGNGIHSYQNGEPEAFVGIVGDTRDVYAIQSPLISLHTRGTQTGSHKEGRKSPTQSER